MSFFVPSNTGLTWNATTSWLSSSAATSPTTWATASTLPGPTDDVFLYGRNITLDVTNINIQSLRNTTSGSISTSGGSATFSSANSGYTISASNGFHVATSSLLVTGTTSQTINISGSQFNGSAINGAFYGIQPSANTTLNISADITGSVSITGPTIYVSNTGCTFKIQGNILCIQGGYSIYFAAGFNTLSITGSVRTTATQQAIFFNNTNLAGIVNILGNIDAPTSTGAAINIGPNGGITINGNVAGGTLASAITFTNSSATLGITITGNVTAGSGVVPAISNTIAVPITVTGTVTAGNNAPGITSTAAASLVTINGKIINTNGYMGVVSQRLVLTASAAQSAQWVYQDPTNNNVTFQTATSTANPPAKEFVRSGVAVSNQGGADIGTFIVPGPQNVRNAISYDTSSGNMVVPSYLDVRSGVAVDSGSGAIIMPVADQVQSGVTYDTNNSTTGAYDGIAAFWAYPTSSMSAGSIGALITQSLDVRIGTITGSIVAELDRTNTTSPTIQRLQNAATVQTTGDQLSSYNT